jgi:N-methylhydantoinase A
MHAIALAEELGITEVVVPWASGAFSAWGMLHTEMRRDLVRSHYRPPAAVDGQELEQVFRELAEQGDALLESDGVPTDKRRFTRHVDMRYTGQEYTITVEAPADAADIPALAERFHADYRVRYGHSTPGAPVETVAVRLTAAGVNDWPMAAGAADAHSETAAGRTSRTVVFDNVPYEAAIVHREQIVEGVVVPGPAIVEEQTATSVVPPGWTVRLGAANALVITADARSN